MFFVEIDPKIVIKSRTLSAPVSTDEKSALRVPLIETKEQAKGQTFIVTFKKPTSRSPSAKETAEKVALKPIPHDQHIKITIKSPKPQFEEPLKDNYQFKIEEQAKYK